MICFWITRPLPWFPICRPIKTWCSGGTMLTKTLTTMMTTMLSKSREEQSKRTESLLLFRMTLQSEQAKLPKESSSQSFKKRVDLLKKVQDEQLDLLSSLLHRRIKNWQRCTATLLTNSKKSCLSRSKTTCCHESTRNSTAKITRKGRLRRLTLTSQQTRLPTKTKNTRANRQESNHQESHHQEN